MLDWDKALKSATDLAGKFVKDKTVQMQLAHEIATLQQRQDHANDLAQMEINKEDSKSQKWWQAGWRPFFGWTGGIAFFNNYVLMPYATALSDKIQPMDLGEMMPVVMGILGLTTARTYERYKKVERTH